MVSSQWWTAAIDEPSASSWTLWIERCRPSKAVLGALSV